LAGLPGRDPGVFAGPLSPGREPRSLRHGEVQRRAGEGRRDAGGEGLHPSSKGKRVKFSGGKKTVTDGPFSETKELIAFPRSYPGTGERMSIDVNAEE
jgi:hypothetical protein